jgi:hypothetical protein
LTQSRSSDTGRELSEQQARLKTGDRAEEREVEVWRCKPVLTIDDGMVRDDVTSARLVELAQGESLFNQHMAGNLAIKSIKYARP